MVDERKEEVIQIEIDKIMIPEERVTSIIDEEILQELEESIKQHGILQPLQIGEVDGKLVLIDGLHRLMIAKRLGMKTVPCIVKKMSEDQLLITNLIMNRQRGKSNPAHEALVLKKLVDEYRHDFDEAAKLLGMSRSTADKYYRIASFCSQKVLSYLSQGILSIGCAYWLSYIEDKGKQDEIAELAVKWSYSVEQCKAASISATRPEEEVPYIIMPTGEMKPRPIPVYPCGREVEPGKIVVVQFDADVWQIVQSALQQLCSEGFFYGEKTNAVEESSKGKEEEKRKETATATATPTEEQRTQKKADWFLQSL